METNSYGDFPNSRATLDSIVRWNDAERDIMPFKEVTCDYTSLLDQQF